MMHLFLAHALPLQLAHMLTRPSSLQIPTCSQSPDKAIVAHLLKHTLSREHMNIQEICSGSPGKPKNNERSFSHTGRLNLPIHLLCALRALPWCQARESWSCVNPIMNTLTSLFRWNPYCISVVCRIYKCASKCTACLVKRTRLAIACYDEEASPSDFKNSLLFLICVLPSTWGGN